MQDLDESEYAEYCRPHSDLLSNVFRFTLYVSVSCSDLYSDIHATSFSLGVPRTTSVVTVPMTDTMPPLGTDLGTRLHSGREPLGEGPPGDVVDTRSLATTLVTMIRS